MCPPLTESLRETDLDDKMPVSAAPYPLRERSTRKENSFYKFHFFGAFALFSASFTDHTPI